MKVFTKQLKALFYLGRPNMYILVKTHLRIQSGTYVKIRSKGTQPREQISNYKVKNKKKQMCKCKLLKSLTLHEKLNGLNMVSTRNLII